MSKKKITLEEFLQRSKAIHGDKYDYSKVDQKDFDHKVTIVCPIHGEFKQTIHNHMAGTGCPKCWSEKRLGLGAKSTEKFIENAKKVHGDKYDYSKTVYINSRSKVTIVCPEHGEFEQEANSHLCRKGCPKCGWTKISTNQTSTTEEFIRKAREVHGDKYDYSKVNYEKSDLPVTIICPKHGEFKQIPNSHTSAGEGCPRCASEASADLRRKTLDKFIDQSIEAHGDKYDYSKAIYINNKTPVKIICPEHGEFEQSPIVHINGHGCPKCANELNGNLHRKSLANLLMNFRKVHGNKYDYSKVVYKNAHEKVEIICPKHGSFFQKPNAHLNGCGCPQCNESAGERRTRLMLEKHQINNTPQMRFNGLKTHPYDFWIPSLNILIEYQGDIHFKSIDHFGGDLGFQKRLENDIKKYRWAELNEMPVLYVLYKEIPEVLTDPLYQGIYKPCNTFYSIEDLEQRLLNILEQ